LSAAEGDASVTTIGASDQDRPTDDDRDTTNDADHDTLKDTVGEPDPKRDPAEEIEENGEPFEGYHA
jgi:hypothetical protein